MDFNNVDDLMEYVNNSIVKAMATDMDSEMKDVMNEEDEYSYTLHEPLTNDSRYRLGLNGSFADRDNLKSEIELKRNHAIYEISNHRETDCQCDYCKANAPLYLDTFIEYGIAGQSHVTPKETIARTEARIKSENIVEVGLRKGLKKSGIEVK